MGHNSTHCPEIQLSDQSSSRKCLSVAAIELPIHTVNLIHVCGLSQLIHNSPCMTHFSQSEHESELTSHFTSIMSHIFAELNGQVKVNTCQNIAR